MRCSVDPHDPYGQGPTGRAIRESTSIVCQEMLTDPSLEPWRERIKVHGFRSCMAIPLKLGERRGAITAFAGDPAFFDPEIADLMHRLVADLEHGLQLIIDRADRARVEQNLLESKARLHALFGSHHVAMLLIDPLTCAVEDATPAAARILNTPLDTLKTQPLGTNPLWTERGLREAAGQALRHDRAETAQLTIPLSDDANLQLSATLSPFPFRDGVRLLCTLEDVTEKLRAIERLHLVQTAIEAAPTGFVIANALGHIQWVNPAFTAMTGYTLEHVVGRTPGILKSGRQDSQFYDHLWKTISRGKTWEGDLQNQRRDGAIYWEHMIIAPVVRANGTIMHYVAIKQDITAQKDMENQVARTQRLESIGLLAGGIAHDLNNVLAPILMAMDLFKLRYPDPADQARFEMVRKSAERGAGIVRQVLTFARGVDGERMSLRPEHLLKEVRNLLQETLHRNIEIDLKVEDHLPPVIGDPTQLHQV
jgi:PAS domain S-box-containing protein